MARVVVGDARRARQVQPGRSRVDEQLVSSVRCPSWPSPLGGIVVADHLEQLGPEHPDHRGAGAGRHADDQSTCIHLTHRTSDRTPDCTLGPHVGAFGDRRLQGSERRGGHLDPSAAKPAFQAG